MSELQPDTVDEVIERIDRLLAEAKPVPLTRHVRLDPERLRALLAELKVAVEERDRWG